MRCCFAVAADFDVGLSAEKRVRTHSNGEHLDRQSCTGRAVRLLFTIIVLGEVIVGVVNGAAGHRDLNWEVGITALLGMLVAIGVWWIFFDSISHHKPRSNSVMTRAWFYLHLIVGMGIAATGAAMLNVIESFGEPLPSTVQWLLVGRSALSCLALRC